MEIICELGGLKGIYTNHSRKQRRATQIYMAGVDEQEIMAKSGHMYEEKKPCLNTSSRRQRSNRR